MSLRIKYGSYTINILNYKQLYSMRKFFFILILMTTNVEARMYQWIEESAGTTQLSGKPPTWYRNVAGGPRVFVFDNGRLIDDTAVQVSDEVRQRMRQQAFILAEEERQAASEKIARAKELKAKFEKDKTATDEIIEEIILVEDSEQEDESTFENITDDVIGTIKPEELSADQLREIINKWELLQAESAKQVLK